MGCIDTWKRKRKLPYLSILRKVPVVESEALDGFAEAVVKVRSLGPYGEIVKCMESCPLVRQQFAVAARMNFGTGDSGPVNKESKTVD